MVIDSALEDALLELLNTAPAIDGAVRDRLAGPDAEAWQRAHGGSGTEQERRLLVTTRDTLQDVVRGQRSAASLATLLEDVSYLPRATDEGIDWVLETPPDHAVAVRAVLAWNELSHNRPGRLRPCANPECRLFLIDRSKPNAARWCSMAVCGNRMKARRHYQRVREAAAE